MLAFRIIIYVKSVTLNEVLSNYNLRSLLANSPDEAYDGIHYIWTFINSPKACVRYFLYFTKRKPLKTQGKILQKQWLEWLT